MIDTKEYAQFWDCLDRWHQVVQYMMRKGHPPRGITEDVYFQLHRDLLRRVQIPDADYPVPPEHWRQSLHHSVRPWVNLNSLACCDKRVLRLLEQEVRQIRDQSMPREYWQRQVVRRTTFGLLVLLLGVIMIGILGSEAERLQGIWDYVLAFKAQVFHGLLRSTINQRLILLATIIVVVGVFVLRNPRSS
jgi:hypothetical protein